MESSWPQTSLQLRQLEGRRVNLSLVNGSRLEGVEVVSAGRGGLSSLWLESDGADLIIDVAEIRDILEIASDQAA